MVVSGVVHIYLILFIFGSSELAQYLVAFGLIPRLVTGAVILLLI